MSSFSAKLKKAQKEKSTPVKEPNRINQTEEDQQDPITLTEDVLESTVHPNVSLPDEMQKGEEFYGEDQQDQDRPKWQRDLPLDRIRSNPFQARKTFDQAKLVELADGMREHGWIGGGLPVRAAPNEPNTYELVWGERRWRAARMAELKTIPCVISPYSDDDMIEKGLLENIQREDLTKLEEGMAYVNLLAVRDERGKPRYSIRRLAQRIGKDKSYVEDRLKYARVPINIQQLAMDQPDISPRIIHELGELAKELQPEELQPVIEGVREGQLRIEDVHAIRKDVERAKQEPQYTGNGSGLGGQSEITGQPIPLSYSVASLVSEASDITTQQDELVRDSLQEPALTVIDRPLSSMTLINASSLAGAVSIGVFERTLKRDHEALERIFQRLTTNMETLTSEERNVLNRYLQRWNTSLQFLISQVEQVPSEE